MKPLAIKPVVLARRPVGPLMNSIRKAFCAYKAKRSCKRANIDNAVDRSHVTARDM